MASSAFTPSARAEKQLKELLKLPANKRCADCVGTGSLVSRHHCARAPVHSIRQAHSRLKRLAGAAVCLRQLQHVRLHELRYRSVRPRTPLCRNPSVRSFDGRARLRCCAASRSRALNHRVKGVSMSTFTLEEVAKLQAGGNEVRACPPSTPCALVTRNERVRPRRRRKQSTRWASRISCLTPSAC